MPTLPPIARYRLSLTGLSIPLALLSLCLHAANPSRPYGLSTRTDCSPWLAMPHTENGSVPQLLSQTGAFNDLAKLQPANGLIPYDLNFSFWSDGADKSRWIAVPNAPGHPKTIRFAPTGEWGFPDGTVFVKHFDLSIDETRPELKRRLETRLLVRDSTGGVYGVTYKWRADNSDADLLPTNLVEAIVIKTASGSRTQNWYYPSRTDCRTCHTANSGGVLGVKTRQLNHDLNYPESGLIDNQLRAWNHIGLFDPPLNESEIVSLPKLARPGNRSAPLEERVRSYLDANCAQCHRPGGVVSYFDARYDTPLLRQNLTNGPVVIDQGIDGARAIAPNDIWRSIIFLRVNTLEPIKMPPLAHETIDREAVALLREWIQSLPGPPVLEPPTISPRPADLKPSTRITLRHSDPEALIRYTLDGSAPGKSAAIYQGPIELPGPATVRARAYKPGFTRSIIAQETFVGAE
jgi:uncharacterized repeat protein (TIGR03806 family)